MVNNIQADIAVVIKTTLLSSMVNTNITFIIHQSQQSISTIVKNVMSLNLLISLTPLR